MREFDDCPIENFEPSHIAEWRNARLLVVEKGTVRRDMNLLKSILETTRKEWGWITVNPIADVKRPSDPSARKRLIEDDERDKVVEALGYAEDLPVITVSQKIAVAFLVAMETGMRAGELVKCNVDGKVARLAITKNGDAREVPLSKRARELFAKVNNKLDINLGSLDALFRNAREKAGLSGFTFHDTRHCACTRLAKKLEPMDLARVLGHRNLRQTLQYYHINADDLADQLD